MKTLAALLLLLAPLASAQSSVSTQVDFQHSAQTAPFLAPTSPTDIWTSDVYLEAITLTNETSSAVTCTVQDRQQTPRAYFKSVSIAANTAYDDQHIKERWFPGGLTISCNTSSAVTVYLRVRY